MDADIADQLKERLTFFNMAGDEEYYPYVRQALGKMGEQSLDKFYALVGSYPHLREKFTSQEAMNGARRAQVAHWGHLFTGRPTPEYAMRAQQIGKVHSRIGLEPRWYIGGYANVIADVIVHLVKSSPYGRLPGMDKLAKSLVALVRAAMLDMEIAVSTYFDAEQEQRNEMLSKFGDVLGRLAQGDLTVNMPSMQGQFGELSDNFNGAIRQLHEAMASVAYSVEHIHSGSDEIRVASDDFAARTERQSASLEETAAAMAEVTGMIQQGATQTATMNENVGIMQKEIAEGGQVVASAVEAMDQIHHSSSEIAQIIDVIEGIAFQTNLLALNAGVEGAGWRRGAGLCCRRERGARVGTALFGGGAGDQGFDLQERRAGGEGRDARWPCRHGAAGYRRAHQRYERHDEGTRQRRSASGRDTRSCQHGGR